MSGDKPSLSTVLERTRRALLESTRVSGPGKITAYDDTKCRASVQLLIKENLPGPDGERSLKLPAVINDVPVIFEGSGGSRIRYPISRGDIVLVVHSDRSLDRWLYNGGEIDPGDDRLHHIGDAVAYPGLMDFVHAKKADRLIEFTTLGEVKIGAQVGHQPTIKGTTHNSAMGTFLAAMTTYVTGIQGIADPASTFTPAMLTAITNLGTALTAMLTQHVKVT